MNIPRIGSIPLFDENIVGCSGGAFLLSTKAKSDEVLHFDTAEIEVHAQEPYAVVRFKGSEDASSTFSSAHRLVHQGFDMLSILGKQDSVILDAENEHILCWSEHSGIVIRTVSTTLLEFAVGSANLVVKDKDGNVIPSVPPSPQHHPAFRYYRLAQTTDDLFDAYRNMYLAFEVLLSAHYPKIRREREIDWLRRALSAASADIPLTGLGTEAGADIVETTLNEIYQDARLPLFHAKEGREFYIPQDSSARVVVSHALSILTKLVLRMAEKWYSARRMGVGVFFGWVYDTLRTQLASCVIYASNYDGPFDPTERDLSHPRFESALTAPCTIASELEREGEPALMGNFIGVDFTAANPVQRVEIATKEHPYLA
jgi:Methylamine utilization protein MauJ